MDNVKSAPVLSVDRPSNTKKEDVSPSCRGCNEVKPTFPGDDWGSSALEQRTNDREISSVDKTGLAELSLSGSQVTNVASTYSQSSELEDSVECRYLNETYSVHLSESKLKNESLVHLNLQLDPEIQKEEEMFFDILEHQGDKTAGLERICEIPKDDCKATAADTPKRDNDEDSQQEYHSAEEQEYVSSCLPSDRSKTLSVSTPEAVELGNSGCEGKRASSLEDNRVRWEGGSVISLDSWDIYDGAESPRVSRSRGSVAGKEHQDPERGGSGERGASLLYHTAPDDTVPRSSSLGNHASPSPRAFMTPQKALKAKIYTEKVKSQITESKDFCGSTTAENKILQHLEGSSMLPKNTALAALLQPCGDCAAPWSPGLDASGVSACAYSQYPSIQSTPDPALGFAVPPPRLAVRDHQALKAGGLLTVAGGSTVKQPCFYGVADARPESATSAARCVVRVHQAVDVSADFRARFTASRATSARASVVSASTNTEITMMNKRRPAGSASEKQRSVACNTDWPDGEDARGPAPEASGASDGHVLSEDSQELRKTSDTTDLKNHPERGLQAAADAEGGGPSVCCRRLLQRARDAELHLLSARYQLCQRHGCDLYRLVTENREGLNRNLSSNSAKKELGSALLSVLGALRVRYESLKEKIHKGIPLEELPPLAMESKLLSTFSAFASRLMKEEPHVFSGADSELDNQSACEVDMSSGLKKTPSQVSLLPDSSHPKQDTSPSKDGLKNGDINVDFSQLKLDDRDCRRYQEVSDNWFDAKENLTGADFSGIQENQVEQEQWNPKFTPELKNVEPSGKDKGFLIHVGGLCPSVSEADLRSHFQKYQVSAISIDDSSSNYRYASLAFKKNSDAKMAVKEMNGVEISGRAVNVRLVKTPGECASPLPSTRGNRARVGHLEKTNQEAHSAPSASRPPRTRPRQRGPEQDSEFFPLDQHVKKNCKQIESARLLPGVQFVPPHSLNMRSFTKIVKRLAELHPEVSRDQLIDALQEVRTNHHGFLNGLPIHTIVEMTSSVLRDSASS
ncbi:RNA-binding protein 44 isoform X2 [Oryctolagus cuniculus]|uniref:RNA-binding protein 44 isoform X2 n=1 Tax=Oryctolagus cuniculus TaxID=9986 RepID=UPI00222E962C|nr:RNA-binding protein 44 isoform X2 [Oryctolagus cuniculus]